MSKYTVKQAENGLWMVVEEGSANPVPGEEGFRTGMKESEAKQLAERLNVQDLQGKDERS